MKHWLLGATAATALLVACGGEAGSGDAVDVDVNDVAVGEVRLPGLSLRTGDASEAAEALAALNLTADAGGRVTFADQSLDGAAATFTEVQIDVQGEEGPFQAGSLSFAGLEMTDTGPSFGQMTFNDVTIQPADEEAERVSIDALQLTNPSPELAAWVASLFGNGEPGELPAAETLRFDGLSMSGFSVDAESSDELDQFEIASIDLRGMGPEKLAAMALEGLELQVRDDEEDVAVVMSLGSLSLAGINTSFIGALQESDGDDEEAAAALMSMIAQNPGDPNYDAVILDNLTMDIGGVDFA
ncbi:MAG: hypothetical protein AAGJ50_07490, partial [Pseudomonadota bacterium]